MFSNGWGSNRNLIDDAAESSNWGKTDQPTWEDVSSIGAKPLDTRVSDWDNGDDDMGGFGW